MISLSYYTNRVTLCKVKYILFSVTGTLRKYGEETFVKNGRTGNDRTGGGKVCAKHKRLRQVLKNVSQSFGF